VVGDRAVITVEPMLEFAAEELHIGIEETVLITDDGAEVPSVGLPTEVDELLALVGSSSPEPGPAP
jgi:hypothetical protein